QERAVVRSFISRMIVPPGHGDPKDFSVEFPEFYRGARRNFGKRTPFFLIGLSVFNPMKSLYFYCDDLETPLPKRIRCLPRRDPSLSSEGRRLSPRRNP